MSNRLIPVITVTMIFLFIQFINTSIYNRNVNELKQTINEMRNKHTNVQEQLMRQETFNRQLECLAMNIYHEARSESYDGQLAVATVTMNRVDSDKYPKTVCGVVWQKNNNGCQFSWTCDGKSDRIRNQRAYSEAIDIAEKVLLNGERSYKIDDDVMYYHADYVNPNWEERWNAELIAQVDSHKFYRIAYAN